MISREILIKKLFKRRKITPSGCWEYQGARSMNYGTVWDGDRDIGAHRLAYLLFVGSIDGWFICHRCDNPPCFNPKHLFRGTCRDNGRDMSAKGRARGKVSPGELNGNAILTDEKVAEIKKLYRPWHITARFFSDKFGVSVHVVEKIVQGKAWVHVKP